MAKNLPKTMPAKATFVYDNGTGERDKNATTIIKGKGDLRSRPGQNNGK